MVGVRLRKGRRGRRRHNSEAVQPWAAVLRSKREPKDPHLRPETPVADALFERRDVAVGGWAIGSCAAANARTLLYAVEHSTETELARHCCR